MCIETRGLYCTISSAREQLFYVCGGKKENIRKSHYDYNIESLRVLGMINQGRVQIESACEINL